MQQFLSTWFNLCTWERVSEDGQRFKGLFDQWINVSPDIWTEQRLDIFERSCVPSVINQTIQDFTWVVFVDPKTPDRFFARFTKIQEAVMPIKMVVLPCPAWHNRGLFSYRKLLAEYISLHILPKTTRVLTTRLDNDDLLERDFMKMVQRAARAIDLSSVSVRPIVYSWGYFLRVPGNSLRLRKYVRNQFPSVVEGVREGAMVQTIWAVQHAEVSRLGPVIALGSEESPGWITLIHGNKKMTSNAGNVMCGIQVAWDSDYMKVHFGIAD